MGGGRNDALLEAVLAIGSDLELQSVLHRIVESAVTLVDAEYGALGVLGEGGNLAQFVTVGIAPEMVAEIGALPSGHGILGVLIDDPRPLRLEDLTRHAASFGFPAKHPPMHTFLGVPIRVREQVFGNLYLTEKRGGRSFTDEDEAVVSALASAAGVAVDNARLYEQSRQRERSLHAASEVATRLLSGNPPETLLAMVAAHTCEIAGAEWALLAMPGRQSGLQVRAVTAGAPAGHGERTEPEPHSLVRQVYSSGKPERVDELALLTAPLIAQAADPGGPALLVPLGTPGAVRGVIAAVGRPGSRPFTQEVEEALGQYAAQATVAFELAERRRDTERLVIYEDRDRIARDLHDLVIQRLFATGMALESVVRRVSDQDAAARVRRAVDDLDETIREIRSTIYALQAVPEAADLRAQILSVAQAAAETLHFDPEVRLSGEIESAVGPAVADNLLAVLREALSNAARHARASRVEVEVEVVDGLLALQVRDNGIGLPAGGRRSGLAHMEQRAVALGGSFRAERPPEGGTLIRWQVHV